MANATTISAFLGGTGRNQIAPLVLSTVTETVLSANTDSGSLVPAVLALPTGTGIIGASAPINPSGNPASIFETGREYGKPWGTGTPAQAAAAFNGRPFLVNIMGTFTSGVAANDLKISLYMGSSATIASDSLISAAVTTGTSGNFGAVSGKFCAQFLLMWDSTTGKLSGCLSDAFVAPSGVATTYVGGAAVTETNPGTSIANVNLVASVKWNAANAGNTIIVTEFSLCEV